MIANKSKYIEMNNLNDNKADKLKDLVNIKFNFNDFMNRFCTFLDYGNYAVEQKPFYCPVCDPNKTDPICSSCFANCHLQCYQKTGIQQNEDNKDMTFTCECGKKKHTIKVTTDKNKIIDKQTCCFYEIDMIANNKVTYCCFTCGKKSLCYICYSKCHATCKKKQRNDPFSFEYSNNANNDIACFYQNESSAYQYTVNEVVKETNEIKDKDKDNENTALTKQADKPQDQQKYSCECDSNNHGNVFLLTTLLQDITNNKNNRKYNYESVNFIWPSQIMNILLLSDNIYKSIYLFIEEFLHNYKQGQTIDFITINLLIILTKKIKTSFIFYFYHPRLNSIIPYNKLLLILYNIEMDKISEYGSFAVALIYLILNVHLKQDFQSFKILSVQDLLVSTPLQRINMRQVLYTQNIYSYALRVKYFDENGELSLYKLCLNIIKILSLALDQYTDKINSIKTLFVGIKVIFLVLKMNILRIEEIKGLIDALEAYYYKLYSLLTDSFSKYKDNSLKNNSEETMEIIYDYIKYITKINLLLVYNFNDMVIYNEFHSKYSIREKLVRENKHNRELEKKLVSACKPEFIHIASTHGLKMFKMTLSTSLAFSNFLFYTKRGFDLNNKDSDYHTFFKLNNFILSILCLTDNIYFKSLNTDSLNLSRLLKDFSIITNLTNLEQSSLRLSRPIEVSREENNTLVENAIYMILNQVSERNPALVFKNIVFDMYSFFEKKIQLHFLYKISLKDLNKEIFACMEKLSKKQFDFNLDWLNKLENSNSMVNNNNSSNNYSNLNTEHYSDQFEFFQSFVNSSNNPLSFLQNNNSNSNINRNSKSQVNQSLYFDKLEAENLKNHFYFDDYRIFEMVVKIIHHSPFKFTQNPGFLCLLNEFTTELIISNIDIAMSKFLIIDFKTFDFDPRNIDLIYSFFELFLLTRAGTMHFILGRNLRRMIKLFQKFPHKTILMIYLISRSVKMFNVNISNHKRLLEIFNLLTDYLTRYQLLSLYDKQEFYRVSGLVFKTFTNLQENFELNNELKVKMQMVKLVFNKKNLLEKIKPESLFADVKHVLYLAKLSKEKEKEKEQKEKDEISEEGEKDKAQEGKSNSNLNYELNLINNNLNNNEDKHSSNTLNISNNAKSFVIQNINFSKEEITLDLPESDINDLNFDVGYLKEKFEKAVKMNKNKMPQNQVFSMLSKRKLSQSAFASTNKPRAEKQKENEEEETRKLDPNSNSNINNNNNNNNNNNYNNYNNNESPVSILNGKLPLEIELIFNYINHKYNSNNASGNPSSTGKEKIRQGEFTKFKLAPTQKLYLDFLDLIGRASFYNSLKDLVFQSLLNMIDIKHLKFLMSKNVISLKQRTSIIMLIRWLYFSNFCDKHTYKQQNKFPENKAYVAIKRDLKKQAKEKSETNKFKVEFYDEMRKAVELVIYEVKHFSLFVYLHEEDLTSIVEYIRELLLTIKLIADVIMVEKMPSNINLKFYELTKEFISKCPLIISIYNNIKFHCTVIGVDMVVPSNCPSISKESFMELKNFDLFETKLIYSLFSDTFIEITAKTDLFLESRFAEFLKQRESQVNFNYKPISLLKLRWSDYFSEFLSKSHFLLMNDTSDATGQHPSSASSSNTGVVSSIVNSISSFSSKSKLFNFNEKTIFFDIIHKHYETSFLNINNLAFLESLDISQHDILINYSEIFFTYCIGGIKYFNEFSETLFLTIIKILCKAMYYNSNHIAQVFDMIFGGKEFDDDYIPETSSNEFIVISLCSFLMKKINLSLLLAPQCKIYPEKFYNAIDCAQYGLMFLKTLSQNDDSKDNDLYLSKFKMFTNCGALVNTLSPENTNPEQNNAEEDAGGDVKSINKSLVSTSPEKRVLGSILSNQQPKEQNAVGSTSTQSKPLRNSFLFEHIKNKITSFVVDSEAKEKLFELKDNASSINKKDKDKEKKEKALSDKEALSSVNTKANKDRDTSIKGKDKSTKESKKASEKDKETKDKDDNNPQDNKQQISAVLILNAITLNNNNVPDLFALPYAEHNFIELLCCSFKDILNYIDINRYYNGDLPGDNLFILLLILKDFLREILEGIETEKLEAFYQIFKPNLDNMKQTMFFKNTNNTVLASYGITEDNILANNFNFRNKFNLIMKYHAMDLVISFIEEGDSNKILPDLLVYFKPIEIFNEIIITLNSKLSSMKSQNLISFASLNTEDDLRNLTEIYRFSSNFYDSIDLKLTVKYFDYLMILREVYQNSTIINFYENLLEHYKEGDITENYLIFKFLSTLFLKIEVEFDMSSVKDFQFFMIPPVCFQLSEQTKTTFLNSVNRESTYTKILSLLNATDYMMYEMFYYDKLIKTSGKSTKFFLSLQIYYFELFNYLIILVQQVLVFINFQNNNITSDTSNPNSEVTEKNTVYLSNLILSCIQLFYLLITLVLWWYAKFQVRFTQNLMNEFGKSFLFQNNPANVKKIINYLITHNTMDEHIENFISDIPPIPALDYLRIMIIDTLFFNNELMYLLLSVIFDVVYIATGNSIFLVLQVLFLVNLSVILYGIVIAVKMRYIQLLSVLAFTYLIVYVFSYFAFYYLYQSFYFQGVLDVSTNQPHSSNEYFCNNSLYCFLTHLSYGVRSGGGIGDVLPMVSFTDDAGYYVSRILYDICFHICVVWIMGNIFFGIIVDTFADLRDKNSIRENDIQNVCYICQIDRDTCVTKNIDFDKHILNDHYVWNYVYFLTYLHLNNSSQFKKLEDTVWTKLNDKDTSWLPNAKEKGKGGDE